MQRDKFKNVLLRGAAAVLSAIALSASAAPLGVDNHVHGPQCVGEHGIAQMLEARAKLEQRVKVAQSIRPKLGSSGGNNVCRVISLSPPEVKCENSDALFAQGVNDRTTWAVIDLAVWIRDSHVAEFGSEAASMTRLRAIVGDANRIFAQSDTKVQLRVAKVIRGPDNLFSDEDLALVPAKHSADAVIMLGGVNDAKNTRFEVGTGTGGGCTRNSCGWASFNGVPFVSYFGVMGALDHTATAVFMWDLAGADGSFNSRGEVIIASVRDLGSLLAHEMGHLMGVDHPRPLAMPHLPYGKGFIRDPIVNNVSVADVMSGGSAYTFSNPNLVCADGLACGLDGTNDAARAIREVRFEFASFATAPAQPAGNRTGLWWTPVENGTGWTITQNDGILVAVWFTYGFDGAPTWYIASRLDERADGSFQGSVYRVKSGRALHMVNGSPAVNFPQDLEEVGSMAISFNDAGWGQVSFEISGGGKIHRDSKWLVHQVFGPDPVCTSAAGSRSAATNFQDHWGTGAEPGWGVGISHQGDIIFTTWYTYDVAGKATWYSGSRMDRQPDGAYVGNLYALDGVKLDEIGGPMFHAWTSTTNDASKAQSAGHFPPVVAGTGKLQFVGGDSAVATVVLNGVTTVKNMSRYRFGNAGPVCQ